MSAQDVLQTLVSGVALGGKYALVALGFVVIFKATDVVNFAHAAIALVGAYLTYQVGTLWGLGFTVGLALSITVCTLISIAFERTLIRPLTFRGPAAVVLVTIIVAFAIETGASAIWGGEPMPLGDPWGLETFTIAGTVIAVKDVWAIAVAAALVAGTFAMFRFTATGLGMRATAADREAAQANGIDVRRVNTVVWGLAGALAAVGGVMLATGSVGLHPGLMLTAFAAFPAMMLGGIDSPGGAVVGGVIIGLVQQFAALLQPVYAPFLGIGFDQIAPYLVLVAVLLVRPSGLFGSREVVKF